MTTYTKQGTVIKADQIVCEARKISKIQLINKSGRHKAQRITLKDNAKCVIVKPLKMAKIN